MGAPKTKETLTQERLKELLHYEPETGLFTRLITLSGTARKGMVIGNKPMVAEYVRIFIDGRPYQAHRLAWLYMEGYFPEYFIDHINRVKTDNRWCNLRHVSTQCNMRNTGNISTTSSGVKGVAFAKACNKWNAQIKINNKSTNLGHYSNFDDAVIARYNAEVDNNWSNCDSNSPAYQYLKENKLLNSPKVRRRKH